MMHGNGRLGPGRQWTRACWGCGDWPMGWTGGAEEQNGRRSGSGGAGCGDSGGPQGPEEMPQRSVQGLTAAAEEECLGTRDTNFHLFLCNEMRRDGLHPPHKPGQLHINLPAGPYIKRRPILPTPRWPFAPQDEVGIAWPARDQSSFGLSLAIDVKRPRQTSPALPSPTLQRAVLPVFTDWPLR